MAISHAEYSVTNGGVKYTAAIVSFSEAMARGKNTYSVSITSPLVYHKAEKLGFFPQPTGAGANNYSHFYYAKPTEITTTGQDLVLREEVHEAILHFALAYAQTENKKVNEAQVHRNTALQLLMERS